MIEDVAAEVRSILASIERKVTELREKINSVLAQVPGWLDWVVDRVVDAWNSFCDKIAQFWDWFADKLAHVGDPGALSRASLGWQQDVGGPASAQSQRVDEGDLKVDTTWSGDAAEEYRQKLPEQKSAMEAIRDEFATVIAGALDTLRVGVISFWVGAGLALITLVGGIAGAITATGTIVGLPAAPVIAGIAVAACLAELGGGVAILTSTAGSANSSMTQARSYGMTSWPTFAL